MKFKPKEVMVNLPTVLTFQEEDEIVEMAAAFNNFIHGKVKMKYEILGVLGGQHVGLFYLQRNNESQQLRDEFVEAINQEEQAAYNKKTEAAKPTKSKKKAEIFDESEPRYTENPTYGDDDDNDPFNVSFTNCWGTGKGRY